MHFEDDGEDLSESVKSGARNRDKESKDLEDLPSYYEKETSKLKGK